MKQPIWFIPGRSTPPQGPLARYRSPQPAGVVTEYVQRLTDPGDLVLDLFCQGDIFLGEAVRAGRRALGVNVNPVSLLIAGLGLEGPPDSRALNTAFTHLGDIPKGEVPLRRHILSLYRTSCPACGGMATAEWFAWDREKKEPYAKAVRCPHCRTVQEGPAAAEDVAQAQHFEPRGLAYHYALNQVLPVGHAARERTAELITLYTPRNLSALMDVVMRLERLDLERPIRAAMHALLLSAFDRGSSLDPYGEERPRPRVLRPPARFLERNVWFLLEEGVTELTNRSTLGGEPPRRASSLSALLEQPTPAYFLLPSAAREVAELLPLGRFPLILADPPPPDGVFWALCALWSGWLWDAPPARAMRPFLRRRRFDWEWHREVLQRGLAAAARLLPPDGHLVLLSQGGEDALVASACMAAAGAGGPQAGWGASAGEGRRLAWRFPDPVGEPLPVTPAGAEKLATDLTEATMEAVRDCLTARGEPTPWPLLHAAIYTNLADGSLLAQATHPPDEDPSGKPISFVSQAIYRGLEELGAERIEEELDLWWLPILDTPPIPNPLADRVEERARRILLAQPREEKPVLEVYADLDGPLTPDLALVLISLASYAVGEDDPWQLREEDDPARRAKEIRSLRRDLRRLGRGLGFQVRRGRGWDVRWCEEGKDLYLFLLSSTAALGRSLLAGPSIPKGARACLVFPGSRAELLIYKLRRDPRLARIADEAGWQFIKFRHLRRLIAEDLDRHVFETVLGLDPILEEEGVQIPLGLDEAT